jgi:hypothetical protein
MVDLVYIDETGSVGAGGTTQPYLTLVGVIVPENKVRALTSEMRRTCTTHLGWVPADFEFHGHEIWQGIGYWKGKQPPELIAAYKAAIQIAADLELTFAHSSINKALLHARYNGGADENAYMLALQFLLEKLEGGTTNRIVIADEAKEQELRAVKMVADLQQWGGGVVPGRQLNTVIDSLHFVRSHVSAGVQMADLAAYVLQRSWHGTERHPDAASAMAELRASVDRRTITWREPWPSK